MRYKKYKRILWSLLIIALLINAYVFINNKSVQAFNLTNDFQEALKNNSYDEAKNLRERGIADIIINKLFSFGEKSSSYTKEQYVAIKNEYLADVINYNEFNSNVEELEKLNSFKEEKSEREAIEEIEALRVSYRKAEAAAGEKDYKGALDTLANIEAEIDEAYKKKLNNLKVQIQYLVLKDVENQLNAYISKGKYGEGIALLESKKGLVPNYFINENIDKLHGLIEKRNAAAELKKKEAEEAAKKEAARLAAYLTNYVPSPEKESAVSTFSSKTSFLVWVDLTSQKTNIFVGSKGNWKLIHSFSSSTGKAGKETPTGTFTIKDRGKWFFSEKYQQGARDWVRFSGEYLFHSLPMDQQQKQVVDTTLGTPASHGCIRLGMDNALWFYNNIPAGTTIYQVVY